LCLSCYDVTAFSCPFILHPVSFFSVFFFFNDTAPTEIYTLSLHDALPIFVAERGSTVTVVEDLSSEGATPRIAIPHVDVYAGPGARVRYVAIRRFATGVVDLGFQRFRSANDSDVAVHNVFAGEGNSKVGIQSDI